MTQITLSYGSDQQLSIKEGDQRPTLEAVLERGRIRTEAADLTDATEVRLYVQNSSTGDLLVNQPMDVVDAENGIVEYEFTAGDTVQGGRNEFEIVVEWSGGDKETFPKRGYGVMQVSETLDRELDPADLDDADISVTILRTDQLRANTGQSVSIEDDLQFNGNDATGIGSLDTEELTNGLAGAGNNISGILGTQGETVPFLVDRPVGAYTTTSSDWETFEAYRLDTTHLGPRTNSDTQRGAMRGRFRSNDDTAQAQLRWHLGFDNLTLTEISQTGTSFETFSDERDINFPFERGSEILEFQGRVDAGGELEISDSGIPNLVVSDVIGGSL